MIPIDIIDTIFDKVSTDMGKLFIRQNQECEVKDRYPYGTYLVSSDQIEGQYQNIRYATTNQADPNLTDVITLEKNKDMISLNFYSDEDIDSSRSLAREVWDWFRKMDNRDFCKSLGVIPQTISTQVQDRTAFQEAFYAYQVGFDIRFDYSYALTETIEGISSVNIILNPGNSPETITIPRS